MVDGGIQNLPHLRAEGGTIRLTREATGVRPLQNTPSTASTPPPKGERCYPCVRYDLSPMSRAAHVSPENSRAGGEKARRSRRFAGALGPEKGCVTSAYERAMRRFAGGVTAEGGDADAATVASPRRPRRPTSASPV